MDDFEEREKIVLRVLADADDDVMRTSEVLDEAQEYDRELEHNTQITRVFDDLEDGGLIDTFEGEPNPPLEPPRVASLTPRGEREAVDITVTPLDVDDIDDLEELVWELREELDAVRDGPSYDDLDDEAEQRQELENRLEAVSRRVEDLANSVSDAEDEVEETRESVEKRLSNRDAEYNGIQNRLTKIDEKVGETRSQLTTLQEAVGNASALAEKYDEDSLASVVESNRGYISDLWNRLFGGDQQ
ncbi:DNA repair exonuclease SbcCD ATPase subunit [Halarchaeum solikamskense]|uniref:hypothetical protein n=1 Tax=Halarchaeum nitratireducens TaxID=489913 RepID=UPI001B3AC618|nr:hypothetical protein [Halarchaeum solikamskense]MBP2251269.1 DNA repair exonuclease SbcCD ATPase subunit [Halarchaeum solikamskense]